jgi:hypothetical protein
MDGQFGSTWNEGGGALRCAASMREPVSGRRTATAAAAAVTRRRRLDTGGL